VPHVCLRRLPITMNTVEPSSNLPHSHASPTRCPFRSALGVRLVSLIIPAIVGSPRTRYMSLLVWVLSTTRGLSAFALATLCFLLAKCFMAVRGPSVLENFNSCKHSSQVLSPLGAVESFSLVSFTALYMATCRVSACCSAVTLGVSSSEASDDIDSEASAGTAAATASAGYWSSVQR
jgi:hypothetical protein